MRPTVETRLGFEDQPSKNPDSGRIAKRYGIAGIYQRLRNFLTSGGCSHATPALARPTLSGVHHRAVATADKLCSSSCSKSGVGCSGVLEYCACCELHPADVACNSDLAQDSCTPALHYFARPDSRARTRAKRVAGLSLIEILVVLTIIALIAALITTSVLSALKQQNQRVCLNNMLTIEAAKDEYLRDHPGATSIPQEAFPPYFRFGIPRCPDGGTYNSLYSLTQPVTCTYHTSNSVYPSPTP
jgi:prepilin-type N-terminal cleavage/methylation domain-containing protein